MEHATTASTATASRAAPAARWMILAILFAVTTINYADRATISIAGPLMSKALGLSPVQMGFVFSAFAWSYVAAQLPGGWLLDRFGSKTTYFFSILLWSVFTLFTGFTGFVAGGAAVTLLFALRLAVGASEAPSFPGNSRITSAWFPTHERGLASAIFNAAQYFATVLFAPIMGWLAHSFGWQSVFWCMGALGVAMAFIWLGTMRGPKQHPGVDAEGLEWLRAGGALVDLDEGGSSAKRIDTFAVLRELLANRMLLGVYIGQYCINTLTYFFLTWFPDRHAMAVYIKSLPPPAK